jgi:hypothetical protein
MNKDPLEILTELAAGPDPHSNSVTLEWEMEDKEKEILGKFKNLVGQISAQWGEADYSGRGPGGGIEIPALRGKLIEYSAILEVSFWKRENTIFAVMVTGHDANTLLCLTLIAIKL